MLRIPAAASLAFSQGGDSPTVTPSKTRAVKRGQSSGHPNLRTGDRPGRSRVLLPGRGLKRRARGGVQLPRDPVDAEAVGTVGRDLELEHIHGDRQHLRERGARRELRVEGVENEDAAGGRTRVDLEI
jgi:hypothetical protein